MSLAFAEQLPEKTVSETRICAVSFADMLESGETMTGGTLAITEATTSGLTLANKAVTTGVRTILGESVAIGLAVQFTAAGGTAGTTHLIKISITTSATPAQTFVRGVKLPVIADPA